MSETGTTSAESIAVDLVDWLDAWNDHDVERTLSFYTDDLEYQDPSTGGPLNGLPALEECLRKTWQAIPDLAFTARRLIVQGDWIAAEWFASGTAKGEYGGLPATGRRFDKVEGVDIAQTRGDKIAVDRAYFDLSILTK